jgi:hypothetical protein
MGVSIANEQIILLFTILRLVNGILEYVNGRLRAVNGKIAHRETLITVYKLKRAIHNFNSAIYKVPFLNTLQH